MPRQRIEDINTRFVEETQLTPPPDGGQRRWLNQIKAQLKEEYEERRASAAFRLGKEMSSVCGTPINEGLFAEIEATLISVLSDSAPSVRYQAVVALIGMGSDRARQAFKEQRASETDEKMLSVLDDSIQLGLTSKSIRSYCHDVKIPRKKSRTTASPNHAFMRGVGSVLDISPAPTRIEIPTHTRPVRQLMRQVWSRIGDSLTKAVQPRESD